jgi:hypothetical protein
VRLGRASLIVAGTVIAFTACGGAPGSGVGAPCGDGVGMCQEPLQCFADFASGYCTTDCSVDPCPDGSACTPVGGASLCMRACSVPGDCRAEYQCFNAVCVPRCTSDPDCGSVGFQCIDGQCTPYPGAPLGDPCQIDMDCSSRTCFLGTCVQSCNRESQCASGMTCTLNPIGNGGQLTPTTQMVPICVTRRGTGAPGVACVADADCDRGSCQYGICVELCGASPDCHGANMSCAKSFIIFDDASSDTYQGCLPKTGMLTVDSPTADVPLPSTAQAFAVFVHDAPNFSNTVGIGALTDPAGTVLYTTPQSQADYYAQAVRYLPSASTSTMLVPNSPKVSLMPGVYTTQAFSQLSPLVTPPTTLYIKLGPSPPATGSVVLNFYITNLSGACRSLTVANAASTLSGAVSSMMQVFGQVGVTITNVTYQATGAPNSIRQQTQPTGQELSDLDDELLAATSGQSTTPGFDVVILRSIRDENGNASNILGVAGGIPASPVNGTPHSGVVVTLDALCGGGSALFAATASHELGHSVGLFHNVEQDGHHDPLTDTAVDGDTNLMFWLENQIQSPHLSVQQGQVIRNDPKVKQ